MAWHKTSSVSCLRTVIQAMNQDCHGHNVQVYKIFLPDLLGVCWDSCLTRNESCFSKCLARSSLLDSIPPPARRSPNPGCQGWRCPWRPVTRLFLTNFCSQRLFSHLDILMVFCSLSLSTPWPCLAIGTHCGSPLLASGTKAATSLRRIFGCLTAQPPACLCRDWCHSGEEKCVTPVCSSSNRNSPPFPPRASSFLLTTSLVNHRLWIRKIPVPGVQKQ